MSKNIVIFTLKFNWTRKLDIWSQWRVQLYSSSNSKNSTLLLLIKIPSSFLKIIPRYVPTEVPFVNTIIIYTSVSLFIKSLLYHHIRVCPYLYILLYFHNFLNQEQIIILSNKKCISAWSLLPSLNPCYVSKIKFQLIIQK